MSDADKSTTRRSRRPYGAGRIFQRGTRWWVAYHAHHKEYREPAGTEADAKRLLKQRLKEIHGDRFIGPEGERLTVGELLDALVLHLETKGAKSDSYRSHVKAVRNAFGFDRALSIGTARVERYAAEELRGKKAPATVNREIGVLKQAFRLALKQERLNRAPYFPMLKEDNARPGFFEHHEFEAVVGHLPEAYADAMRFAYLTGWRRGEIMPLRWDAVDRIAGQVRLRTSKNGRGRVLPLEGELRTLIDRRWSARQVTTPTGETALSPLVFHHRNGQPLGDFRKAWATACRKAGVPGKLFHDLRRTAVRNMIRAGVSQTVAMSISGHRTISMFNRYNITSDADQRDALRRVQGHLEVQQQTSNVIPLGAESGAKTRTKLGQ
jgi:integrase